MIKRWAAVIQNHTMYKVTISLKRLLTCVNVKVNDAMIFFMKQINVTLDNKPLANNVCMLETTIKHYKLRSI